MTALKGSLVLIKIGNGGGPETFATAGGLLLARFLLGSQAIEANTLESGAWRKLAAASGARSVRLEGSGIFTNAAAEETLRGYAFAGSVNNFEFHFANGNRIAGPFLVAAYERSGEHDGVEMYRMSLESAGTVTFAAS